MSDAPWDPSLVLRHRRGWKAVITALAFCVAGFILSGSGADPRNALPWGWTATGWVTLARGLAFVWLFAGLLFAILSRIAFRLQIDWPPAPRSVRWSHAVALLLVTFLVYVGIALCWKPLRLDPVLLAAKTLPLGGIARLPGFLAGFLTIGVLCAALVRRNCSIWWAALVALHPLMLWQCAANGSHYCIAALLLVLLCMFAPKFPLATQSVAWMLLAGAATLAVGFRVRGEPFASPSALVPVLIAPPFRLATEAVLQVCLLNIALRRRWPFAKTLGHILLLMLIMMPVVMPGMALLPLVLIPFAWNRTTWALSLSILLALSAIPTLRATGHFHVPVIIATLQWIPIVVLLAQDLLLEAISLFRRAPAAPAVVPSP